jgi:phenylacetyl-CoA:acceptor oxidoreductase subunit 2
VSRGPNPWQQAHWDARAAGNFIGGGVGSGLVVAAYAAGAGGGLRSAALVLALALIGGGLVCVWAEIGRPWRALNVIFNPRTSWMTREALVAPLLLGGVVLMLARVERIGLLVAAVAVFFVYCQARILRAARGIPAWREPLTVPLIVLSGLTEGAGLYAALSVLWGRPSAGVCFALALLLALRSVCGLMWRRRVARALRGNALRSLQGLRIAPRIAGPLPLVLAFAALLNPLTAGWVAPLQLLAGVLALAGGAWFKFALVTRAAFNQGFALQHLPVRGVRRAPSGATP